MFGRHWHRKALSRNFNTAFNLPIVPDDPGVTALLPQARLLATLDSSMQLSRTASMVFGADVNLGKVIKGELETMQTRSNYTSAATGVGAAVGVGRVLVTKIGEGGLRAGAVYLTQTGGKFAVAYAASGGANYTIAQAQQLGYISDNAKANHQTKPFFLYLSLASIHKSPKIF
jgi:hypothetical protein